MNQPAASIDSASHTWTVTTLKAHLEQRLADITERFEQRFIDQEKAVNIALVSADKAVQTALASAEKAVGTALTSAEQAGNKYEANADKWRANANEWRGAMQDREAKFMSKEEAVAKLEILATSIQALKEAQDKSAGVKAGILSAQALLAWGVGLIVSLISIGGAVIAIAYAVRR